MGDNKDKTPIELAAGGVAAGAVASAIIGVTDPTKEKIPPASAIAGVTDPTKEKIPPEKIIEMLTINTLSVEVMPLLKNVLDIIYKIDGLDTAINDVFKAKIKDNNELGEALKKLQDKLRSFYTRGYTTGGKRRKSKKRNYYKKRRTSKYR
uniref:Uncharacterized protein n=1 Tax=viral metagenome TaxID=1070528 RepID=A0A6C0KSM8_9ZZZZ